MPRKIDSERCISCGACVAECPVDAISQKSSTYFIEPKTCTDCALCESVCPVNAIEITRRTV